MKLLISSALFALAVAGTPALAQGAGGGGTGATSQPQVAACIPPGEDGKPVRKLSSEDVCPMYSFVRDDCARLAKDPNAEPFGLMHCGILRDEPELATGSVAPAPVATRRRH